MAEAGSALLLFKHTFIIVRLTSAGFRFMRLRPLLVGALTGSFAHNTDPGLPGTNLFAFVATTGTLTGVQASRASHGR